MAANGAYLTEIL